MAGLDWLTAQPVAHRGLHHAAAGVIENMPSAFAAAVSGNYGIECDVQITADGEAMVHHDRALGRLTDGAGRLADMSAAALRQVAFKATPDRMISLGELCDLVGGKVPLVVEIKSDHAGNPQLPARVAEVLKGYAQSAPFAMGKFALRGLAQSLARELSPRGIHVAHFVIDGGIRSERRPGDAAKPDALLDPDAIASEVELRPWVENF